MIKNLKCINRLTIQIDAEWHSEYLDRKRRIARNKFITLQVGTMNSKGVNKKMIFEHPDWGQSNPLECNHLKSWVGDTTIPAILNQLYSKSDVERFSQVKVIDRGKEIFQIFRMEVHFFYAFSDIVALLGMDLGAQLAESLISGKRTCSKDY